MRPKLYSATLLITGLALVGCESTETGIDNGGISTTNASNPHLAPTASKLFSTDLDVYGSASIDDGNGNIWVLTYVDATPTGNGTTVFQYTLNKPAGSQGSHFSYRIPACADFIEESASPEPTVNNNANGDYEWGPSVISTGGNTILLEFTNPPGAASVPLGVAEVGLKSPGSGSNQLAGEIVGPCRGRYSFSGVVFLNDNSPDLGEYNDTKDGNEPGLANVEVTLEECYGDCEDEDNWSYDSESGVVKTSDQSGSFGEFSFEVVGPPISYAPVAYRVRISKSALEGGINPALFNEMIFDLACDGSDCPDDAQNGKIFREFELDPNGTADYTGIEFGFEVDEAAAIKAFEDGDLASDGKDRNYWYVQASQKAKGGYSVQYSPAAFAGLLNCSAGNQGGSVDCIVGPNANDNDFAGDVDAQIVEIFGDLTVARATAILKSENNNDDQEGLRTQILAALLNYVTGQGLCSDALIGGECTLDDPGMRTIIENAIVVLVNSGYSAPAVNKASSGSVGSNKDLLSQVN